MYMRFTILFFIFSSFSVFSETTFKVTAEPYFEKSFRAKSQKIDNVASVYGDANSHSIGARLGADYGGFLLGLGIDYTNAIVTNQSGAATDYNLSFQTFDFYFGYRFLDSFKISYSRPLSGKTFSSDNITRNVEGNNNKFSLSYLMNKKVWLDCSFANKASSQNSKPTFAGTADLYDVYSLGLSFPIEIY